MSELSLSCCAVSVGLVSATFITGCAGNMANGLGQSFERCFDAPLTNVQAEPPLPETPLTLHYDSARRTFSEVPAPPSEDNLARLEDGNIMFSEGGVHKGSGWLTTAPDGSQVAVTAAHVLFGFEDLSRITMENSKGERVGASDACFVYENDQQFSYGTPGEPNIKAMDVAIIRPQPGLSNAPLNLGNEFPNRGSWVTFVNNQDQSDPNHPSIYPGIVLETESDPTDDSNDVLTGLEPWRRNNPKGADDTRNLASGGLVASGDTIVGISIGIPPKRITEDNLASVFDTYLERSAEAEYPPNLTFVIGAEALQAVLTSDKY